MAERVGPAYMGGKMTRLAPLRMCLVGTLVLLVLSTVVRAKYPDKEPRMDTCTGKSELTCTKKFKSQCKWDTSGAPDCFEKKYFKQNPIYRDPVDLISRFFTFSYGVHLSEGTNQEIHKVPVVDECAKLCVNSAGRTGIPCLSFDFYPVENPIAGSPHFETPRSGYCILNTSNKDTARLRNSDMGWTDAELFYESHFTHRPFSGEEGYYELRDPRGGQIANMLEYNRGVEFTAQNIWPRSRWGLMYLSTPIEISAGYICTDPDDAPDPTPVINPQNGHSVEFSQDASLRFIGAFTPVDWDQHCVGKKLKAQAQAICQDAGGYLCSKLELETSKQVKLGCNLDKYAIWTAEAKQAKPNQKKFVRCCSRFSVLNICPFFSKSQIDFCAQQKSETDCINRGSGTAKQTIWGYGNLRKYFKEGCEAGTLPCTGLLRNWSTRDACLWCLKPGETEGGAGECRAGPDYGVCANAPMAMQRLFTLKVESQCNTNVICRVATRYEEKAALFDVVTPRPTTAAPTIPTDAPTPRPTKSPTQKPTPPTRKPTPMPTTKSPTAEPTRSPSTSVPSKAPSTSSPSKAPSTSRPSNAPSTPRPTESPSNNPTTSKPSQNPTTSKPSQHPTTPQPSQNPTLNPTSSPSESDEIQI